MTGCTWGRDTPPASFAGLAGGTLRVGMTQAAYFAMDPQREWNYSTWEIFRCCLVRTLMSYDVTGGPFGKQPLPDLAASPPDVSIDGLTWTFHLRSGIHYAPPLEGVEITSGDVARALLRLADPDSGSLGLADYLTTIDGATDYAAGRADSIAGLETPDPYTLRIRQVTADAGLPYLLALPIAAPIPPLPEDPDEPFGVATGHDRSDAPTDAGGYGRFLVASGPYMYEGSDQMDFSRSPEDQTPAPGFHPWVLRGDYSAREFGSFSLVRNPSWQPSTDPLRAALPARIEITGGDGDELFDQMAAGHLDLVFDAPPPPKMLERYQRDAELRPLVESMTGFIVVFATFNLALPPFDDLAVRRAVAYAMDRSSMVETLQRDSEDLVAVAEHFAPDAFEASLLSGWSAFPGADGASDLAAARSTLVSSRYAHGGTCADTVCKQIRVVVDIHLAAEVGAIRSTLGHLGLSGRVDVPPERDAFPACDDPASHIAMCVGLGWAPDIPNASNFVGLLFQGGSYNNNSLLGATRDQLHRWGYDVEHVPDVDRDIDRCSEVVGATQPVCWARLDQYLVSQVMPAVPIAFVQPLRLSSPSIGPFLWDEVYGTPALDRIEAPAA